MGKVQFCSCKHSTQDKFYGKQKRLHNKMQNKSKGEWRCTVCGKEKS